MTDRVTHGKALPPEVVEQVVAKTDGVPLFVEELTKMVLESGLLQEREECYELTGPLPPLSSADISQRRTVNRSSFPPAPTPAAHALSLSPARQVARFDQCEQRCAPPLR